MNVRLPRDDYNYAKAASKPSAMALRLLDKLFLKETLLRSTLYGTKEFASLDPSKIVAIKGKLVFIDDMQKIKLGRLASKSLNLGHSSYCAQFYLGIKTNTI